MLDTIATVFSGAQQIIADIFQLALGPFSVTITANRLRCDSEDIRSSAKLQELSDISKGDVIMFRHSTLAQAIAATAVMLFFSSLGVAGSTAPGRRAPAGFQVLRSTEASAGSRNTLAIRLGGQISKFSTTSFSVQGRPLQMNLIRSPNSTEAAKIHKLLVAKKKHPAFCIIVDNLVVEFTCEDRNLATLAAFELGFKPRPKQATYKLSFRAAPVEKIDYTSWKKLSNMFASASSDPNNLAFRSRVEMLAGRFRFGNEMIFRTFAPAQGAPSYSFEPSAAKTTALTGGDFTRYTFRDLPREVNIPVVSFSATIHTAESSVMPASRKAGPELLSATEYWPSDDPEITTLAAKITADCNSVQEKTTAILRWLVPGKNIRFIESVASSRYGVKNVLRQGFGQAWDFSDFFITLARASKVPCRQVGGWFYSQSAHVWAEVLYEGSGWEQVEPTGGGVAPCGIYHIPYLTSEDGSISIVYLSKPEVEFSEN
jgi:hypothetical protein